MLQLYQSNKLEVLLEHLSEKIALGRSNPLIPERIIVQNRGIGQWVAQQLATRTGILANFSFEQPTSFAWDIIRRFVDAPQRADLEKDELVWQIFAQIYENDSDFEEVQTYLGAEVDTKNGNGAEYSSKLFHLASQLADIYDQYQVYRQDWILNWDEEGGVDNGADCYNSAIDPSHWQVRLWQQLSKSGETEHRSKLMHVFFQLAQDQQLDKDALSNLPQRISIFGIDGLAPVYLQFFTILSNYIDVTIYSFNVCQEYWGDITSEKQIANKRMQDEDSEALEYLESGNNLLSSMGKVGRAQHELLLGCEVEEFDCFESYCLKDDESYSSLLHAIQNDILELRNGVDDCLLAEGSLSAEGSLLVHDSLQVHDCHTPLRELEVLYDQLLNMFDNDTELKPSDIIVMTPDINRYAPSIEAVFGIGSGKVGGKKSLAVEHHAEHYIPWAIADRTAVADNPIIQAMLQLIGISKSRMTSSEVFEILKVSSIASRFGLSDKDLNNIEFWIDNSGIRWGLDAHFRQRFGLPETELNSWQFGLERMLLGYSLGSGSQFCFDRCGYDQIEGSNAEVLGRLTHFIYKVGKLIDQFAGTHSAQEWQVVLNDLLETFFSEDEESEAVLQQVRNYIDDMVTVCDKNALFTQKVMDVDVVLEYLAQGLINQVEGGAFIAGRVTFCSLQPMRAIPFKVVCLLGMNDGEFPRQHKQSSLDLIAQNKPRLGDRNRRDDDRYLFLQSLLSAREKLYISYNGRSVIDNSYKMPSALLCELFDYLERFYFIQQEELITVHPLQPFDKQYFGQESELFSYSKQWLKAFNSIAENNETSEFVDKELPEPEAEFKIISIDDLLRFFKSPSAYLLKNRLGINLDIPETQLQHDEPFGFNNLEIFKISDDVLHGILQNRKIDELYRQAKLSGSLPHGYLGQKEFEVIAAEIGDLADSIKSFIESQEQTKTETQAQPQRVAADVELNNILLSGVIDNVYQQGLVLYRPGKLRPIDRIELNIKHLFLQIAADYKMPAFYFATDESLTIEPVDNPQAELIKMLEFYWLGLSQPLPFFTRSSFAYSNTYAHKLASVNDEDKATEEAYKEVYKEWQGNLFSGEAQEPYNWVAYKGYFPQQSEFAEIAISIFNPKLLGLEVGDGDE